jgi:hypothetical protein
MIDTFNFRGRLSSGPGFEPGNPPEAGGSHWNETAAPRPGLRPSEPTHTHVQYVRAPQSPAVLSHPSAHPPGLPYCRRLAHFPFFGGAAPCCGGPQLKGASFSSGYAILVRAHRDCSRGVHTLPALSRPAVLLLGLRFPRVPLSSRSPPLFPSAPHSHRLASLPTSSALRRLYGNKATVRAKKRKDARARTCECRFKCFCPHAPPLAPVCGSEKSIPCLILMRATNNKMI